MPTWLIYIWKLFLALVTIFRRSISGEKRVPIKPKEYGKPVVPPDDKNAIEEFSKNLENTVAQFEETANEKMREAKNFRGAKGEGVPDQKSRLHPNICSILPKQEPFEKDYISMEKESFEKRLMDIKNDEDEKKRQRLKDKAESDRQSELQFQQKLEKQEVENKLKLEEMKKEIEEFEKETEELLEKKLEEWRLCNEVLCYCILVQQQFKTREKEFAKWLDFLKYPITRAKDRFVLFEKIRKKLKKSYKKEEIFCLHRTTLSAYEIVFEAWKKVESLAKQFPDKIFLLILQKRLVSVSDQIHGILKEIDGIEMGNPQTKKLHDLFHKLNSSDVPTTWQLRDESEEAKWQDYHDVGTPRVYRKQ